MKYDHSISRRRFSQSLLTSVTGITLLSGCHPRIYSAVEDQKKAVILPPKIGPGARIGLIAPASYANETKIRKAMSNLESLGLKVVEGKYLREENGFIAGNDGERVEDIHSMFRRKDIDGIWCVRGGYGTTRMLEMLDYDLIRSHPKVFVGYSDITALHQAFYTQAGLVSFHGPVASSDFTDYSIEGIKAALFEGDYNYGIEPVTQPADDEESYEIIHSGKATGRVVGGNLSLLSALCGTIYMPDLAGKIVFIEDVGEASYRIDRMLVQLIQAAKLKEAAGIVFGNFTNCGPEEGSTDQTVSEVILDHFSSLEIPVTKGYSIGHISNQATLAVGMMAELDADSGVIRFMSG